MELIYYKRIPQSKMMMNEQLVALKEVGCDAIAYVYDFLKLR